MGDLSGEKVVAKHAARQGLVLSTTRFVNIPVTVDFNDMFKDKTVLTDGRIFTFTDGQGVASPSLIQRCATELGESAPVCAIQVRVGDGCKGILVAAAEQSLLPEDTVFVRKSMMKFPSNRNTLNIVKVAKYGVAYLNRQAIILLEALGIPSDTLLDIFLAEKSRIEGIGEGNVEIIKDAEYGDRLDTLTTFPLSKCIQQGFGDDPLVRNILQILKCRLVSDLKWKGRIKINDGAYLMGIMDETGTLGESEVFCQIIEPKVGRSRIIEGECTVFRNPCLHPGDLRRVTAIHSPKLLHYINVVVFPTAGKRDLPSMMGGGDVDGDHYTIMWEKKLLIPSVSDPMDYKGPEPLTVPKVTIEHTKTVRSQIHGLPGSLISYSNICYLPKFFLEHILNNILGVVCNAHMALSDLSDDGPHHPDCIRLAADASRAVDFSKTGVQVERGFPRPSSYPDFMGKMQSLAAAGKFKKVLGKMFRAIDPEPIFEPVVARSEPTLSFKSFYSSSSWKEYLDKANEMKTRYEFELNGLLNTYNIRETECVGGVLLRSRKRRIRVERDYSIRIAVRDAYAHLKSSFLAEAAQFLHNEAAWKAWSLACYYATYHPGMGTEERPDAETEEVESDEGEMDVSESSVDLETSGDEPYEQFYSFPWIFYKYLLEPDDVL
ncbi:hypothetical protein M422DRAFT_44041 [Sphaerobolus stellatus SS14]|nr:hypothetical protein M422DRAFT_44041 [Sphaerobolus stellatus SS14]